LVNSITDDDQQPLPQAVTKIKDATEILLEFMVGNCCIGITVGLRMLETVMGN